MSPDVAVAFLVQAGLLNARDVVEGALCATELRGRNCNLSVETTNGPNYFLKQATQADDFRLVRTEAWVYQRARSDDSWAGLRPWLPTLVTYDEGRATLVTALSPQSCDVLDLLKDDQEFDLPDIGTLLGRALGACHRVPVAAPGLLGTPLLTPRTPWALRGMHRPNPGLLGDVWPAQLEVLSALQRHPVAETALARMAEGWNPDSLVHGDVKFQNLVALTAAPETDDAATGAPLLPRRDQPRDSAAAITGLQLVDWELAAAGDPAWDVGSVFQSYLWYAVHLVSIAQGATAANAAPKLAVLLPHVQRHLREFWLAYRGAGSLSTADAEALLGRATEFAGARLLQTAFETAAGEQRPGRLSAGCLQIGLNILERPAEALRHVIGLGSTGSERRP